MNREEAIFAVLAMLERNMIIDFYDIEALNLAIAALREQDGWVLVLDMTCPKCGSDARPLAYPPEMALCKACGHEFAIETKYRVVEGK